MGDERDSDPLLLNVSNGTLNLYLEEKAAKGFYYVSFRVPGANTGTP